MILVKVGRCLFGFVLLVFIVCSVLARVTSTLKVYVSGVGRGEPSVTGIEQQKVGFVFVFFIKLL